MAGERARAAENFALSCLTYRGPLTAQQIADIGGVDEWGIAAAQTFRRALYRLEEAGEVERCGLSATRTKSAALWRARSESEESETR